MTIWPNGKRPSSEVVEILRGALPLEQASVTARSVVRKHFYDGAVYILRLDGKEARRKALAMIPELVRPHIEAEVLRLHAYRRTR